jgi:hypothetical protein
VVHGPVGFAGFAPGLRLLCFDKFPARMRHATHQRCPGLLVSGVAIGCTSKLSPRMIIMLFFRCRSDQNHLEPGASPFCNSSDKIHFVTDN